MALARQTFSSLRNHFLLAQNSSVLSIYAQRRGNLITYRLFSGSSGSFFTQYSGGTYGNPGDEYSVIDFRSRTRLPRNTIINFVPQQEAWIVERFGKFHRLLEPGLAIVIPIVDRIKYVKSLKEICLNIPAQSAITQDNVTLELDGVLYIKVVDPYKASYGVEDAEYAVAQLAQTTMRAEIGQMTLDRTLAERALLNANIVEAINSAADAWGIRCLRYEIRDIHPPAKVVESMHQQVSAERSKRASILESEGQRQAAINVAEGSKQSVILASEAIKAEQVNRASGEAEAILMRASATAEGIRLIASSINNSPGGLDAVALTVAEKYVEAFGQLAKESTSIIVPASISDAGTIIAQALTIYQKVMKRNEPEKPEKLDEASDLITDTTLLPQSSEKSITI
ncbi:11239_t:CDS:10 [Ambispora gerdemannii]|uniref:11239_t:CDS:1 n=1 Tax=Ambispora gerdemannii TaxID=144530 RepID=A0A9N8ZCC4_9GLOM|nr:11239_t:CDS:10 [Ambispora gerdemannii]